MTVVHFAYVKKRIDVPEVVEKNTDFEYSRCKKIKKNLAYFLECTITIVNSSAKFELHMRYRYQMSYGNPGVFINVIKLLMFRRHPSRDKFQRCHRPVHP